MVEEEKITNFFFFVLFIETKGKKDSRMNKIFFISYENEYFTSSFE